MDIKIILHEYYGTFPTEKSLYLSPGFNGRVRLEIIDKLSVMLGHIEIDIVEMQRALSKLDL
jgi:hypothetical protein